MVLWLMGLFMMAEGKDAEQIFRMTDVFIVPMRIGPNLIPNFSFEEIGSEGVPAGWIWDRRNTDAICDVDTSSAHGGKRSLKFVNSTPSGAHIYGMLWTAHPIRLQPGKPYTLSAYVKSDDPGIAWIGGGANWQFRLYVPPTHGEWRRIWMKFVPSERDLDFTVRIVTESPTKGFWIDDVKLEEGDEPTPCELPDERVLLEPLHYEREIEGDGTFEVHFFVLLPKPLTEAEIIAGQRVGEMDAVLLRKDIPLERGAWRISIKGEARGLDDTPRKITLKLSSRLAGVQPLSYAEMTLRFFSPIDARRRLDLLSQKLPGLKSLVDELRREGKGIDYPLVTITVLENFLRYVDEDLRHGEVRRALMQISDMEKMAERLETAREIPSAHVLRWTGAQRPKVVGPSFIGPAAPLDRSSPPVLRPIFFVGYGHFGQVREDIEKFPNYGVNIIQIEFGPIDIFPQEGVISDRPIKEMLGILDRAAKAGVAVALLISPHYFPEWMLNKYPHLRKWRDGFLRFCLHAPEGQELLKRYIAIIIPPLKDHPALHSICLTNEPVNVEEPCEFAARDWREWLKRRHGDISTLNRRFGTDFRSFEDVPLPDPFDVSGVFRSEFFRFNQEWFASWHKMLSDAIKAIAPDLPIHAKAMAWTMLNDSDVRYGVDAELFADFSDINGNDSVNFYSHGRGEFAQGWLQNAMAYDLQRSVKDAPVFNSENHIIPDRETRYVPPEHVRAALWQGAVHGQSATTIWVWERTFDPRSDAAGSIMHRPGCAEVVGHTCLDLNRLAYEVTALQKVKPHVLLLHSISALIWDGGSYTDCRDKLYIALSFLGLKVGFVTERQLERGEIGIAEGVPVLFIPNVVHLSDAAFETLRRYKGRIVLVGGGKLLSRNEYDEPRDRETTIRNWERITFEYGRTSWRDLWEALSPKLAGWRVEPPVQVRDRSGEPIWGVHWLCASGPDGSLLINLCNYRHDPVELTLWREGKGTGAVDLIGGEEFHDLISLNPLQVRLLKLR